MVTTYVIAAAVVGVLAVAACVWVVHLRQVARIDALEGRVASLLAAVSLLTDTTESGLRDVTAEVGRLSAAVPSPRPRTRAATQRRVSAAARRGQSVRDIAAAEEMSESEVNLRLSMSAQTAMEGQHATLR